MRAVLPYLVVQREMYGVGDRCSCIDVWGLKWQSSCMFDTNSPDPDCYSTAMVAGAPAEAQVAILRRKYK